VREEVRGLGSGWGNGGEMTQTLYAYLNKKKEIQNGTVPWNSWIFIQEK
jgi:hypothetical protein